MKCKNCEKPSIEHPRMDCKQFIPFEDFNEVVGEKIVDNMKNLQNKGCGKRFAVIENIHIPCGLHLCPSCKLKPTNECQISSSNHSSIDDDKDPDSLKRLDEKGTNTSSGSAFILSDKVFGYKGYVIRTKDVAEFIRRSQEVDILLRSKLLSLIIEYLQNEETYPLQDLLIKIEKLFSKKIDKLAGSFK